MLKVQIDFDASKELQFITDYGVNDYSLKTKQRNEYLGVVMWQFRLDHIIIYTSDLSCFSVVSL